MRRLVAVVLLVSVTACADPVQRTVDVTLLAGRKTDDLVVWVGPTGSLHPHTASPHLTSALFSPLVASDPVSRLPTWGPGAPGALVEAIASRDLITWTLTLKTGWRWHDGGDVVAGDVVRGIRRSVADRAPVTSTVTAVEAPDERTVRLTLQAPFGQLPFLLAHPAFLPLPPVAATAPARFAAAPVGNGPYRLTGRQGSVYDLQAVADHPLADRVDIGRIRVHLTARPGATADLAIGPDGDVELPGQPVTRPRALRLPGRQLAYLGFPLTDRRYADPAVRRALAQALDVAAIARRVAGDAVVPADRLVGPGLARAGTVTCTACVHDPAAAAATWPGLDGDPVTIWSASDGDHGPLVEAVAAAWTDVLDLSDLQLATLPAEDLVARLAQGEVSGPFRLSWQADVSSPARVLEPLFGPRGVANDTRYRDREVADALAAAAGERDLLAALDGYARVEAAILADVPVIPLWFSTIPVSAATTVEGIILDGEGRLDWTRLRWRG